ncbi:hypothetical protein K1T71_011680 [Dendrolimus kikuchii]|uniref:Uncharacterized protein n=1 Tax=Dendrolimus kikuchii TaxID=765133 RepID=A0ACC1CLW3_9NEOP|nr:hypothetical protein K1T71_011680 [Dendrolimus kikuchii]
MSVIHNDRSLDNVQKLFYLRSFLKNEPLDIIKNLPLLETSYDEALSLLDKRYFNKYKNINDHICRILIKPFSLRQFVCIVRQNLAALSNLDAKVSEWDPILICIFTRKLDMHTAHLYQLERGGESEPKVEDLLNYFEKRALAMENVGAPQPSLVRAVHAVTNKLKEKPGCHYSMDIIQRPFYGSCPQQPYIVTSSENAIFKGKGQG